MSKARLLWCCFNSYWSAIIAAFFSDVRWQLEEGGESRGLAVSVREYSAIWQYEHTHSELWEKENQRICKHCSLWVSRVATLTFFPPEWLQISDKAWMYFHANARVYCAAFCFPFFAPEIIWFADCKVQSTYLRSVFPHAFDPSDKWKIVDEDADFVIGVLARQ